MHTDFEKILTDFKSFHGDEEGSRLFDEWIGALNLNTSKSYGPQAFREAFQWAEPKIRLLQEDQDVKLYKCEALFALTSMNENPYFLDEVVRAARTLTVEPLVPNWNHTPIKAKGVTVVDSEEEDNRLECVIAVEKAAVSPWGYKVVDMFDHTEAVPDEFHVYHVSIEGEFRGEDPGSRLFLEDLALLTKKILPGIPLTRLVPVEALIPTLNNDSGMSDDPLVFREKVPGATKNTVERKKLVEQEPTVEDRVEWLESDIGYLYSYIDETNMRIDAVIDAVEGALAFINQRIDDLIALSEKVEEVAEVNTIEPDPDVTPSPADTDPDSDTIEPDPDQLTENPPVVPDVQDPLPDPTPGDTPGAEDPVANTTADEPEEKPLEPVTIPEVETPPEVQDNEPEIPPKPNMVELYNRLRSEGVSRHKAEQLAWLEVAAWFLKYSPKD